MGFGQPILFDECLLNNGWQTPYQIRCWDRKEDGNKWLIVCEERLVNRKRNESKLCVLFPLLFFFRVSHYIPFR